MEGGIRSDVIEEGGSGGGHILRLPEECLSHTIALMSPRDVCRSEAVCSAFRAAAVSGIVWRRFLPHDILEVLSRAVDRIEFASMKHLYFQLCKPILIDGGRMSFWLDKEKGSKCFMLSARELFICWGDTPYYWAWNSHPESRFLQVAELLSVCWLEIHGKVDASILSPRTHYAAYLVFKATDSARGLSFPSQEVSVTLGSSISKSSVRLHREVEVTAGPRRPIFRGPFFPRWFRRPQVEQLPVAEAQELRHDQETDPPVPPPQAEGEAVGEPFRRRDGWMEVLLGDFYNEDGEDGEIDMCLKEINSGQWKHGLIVQGIEIRSKS
ncbi:hypothetical protein HPP92_025751 [Vanilla planifolia]|uniref:F-box domain-containing protein n=1 Tax=Vanilla planifolia TaxID=51239 RepID=A0A835PMX4_VANPL|nr:hypothetical protein HPP92_025751 [Vanilla planifolia]